MKYIQELFIPWLFCQTKLKKVLRWSSYILYENGKSARYNGIRRQNVAEHTISKLLAFSMILPLLKNIFKKNVDFDLLWSCIVCHDFGEGLRKSKYDIIASNKKDCHDLEEYLLVEGLLNESDLQNEEIRDNFEKAFLLQFVLTSYESFPAKAQEILKSMRQNKVEKNTAILFQILEKWEYHFYAWENRKKHPTILEDVRTRNGLQVLQWIEKYPKKYHEPLKEIFLG